MIDLILKYKKRYIFTMNHLFTKTSNVLRDNLIVELQKNNDFLRNKLSNINNNPFFGYKVVIKEHNYGMGGVLNFVPRANATIYSIIKGIAWVLYTNLEGENVMQSFHIKYIEFTDPRFNKYFN